jgi:hypothetical protein
MTKKGKETSSKTNELEPNETGSIDEPENQITLQSLANQFSQMMNMMDSISNRLNTIENDFDQIRQGVTAISNRLNTMENDFDQIRQGFTAKPEGSLASSTTSTSTPETIVAQSESKSAASISNSESVKVKETFIFNNSKLAVTSTKR